MVDVMLVLLIIFMVITPMLLNKVQIDMAKVDNAVPCRTPTRTTRLSSLSRAMARSIFGQNKVDPASKLGEIVRDKLADKTERPSLSAPMRARSTGRLKTPSTTCARLA